jgi:hypothetical protein
MSLTLVRNAKCSTCSTVWAPREDLAKKGPKRWLDKGDMRTYIVGKGGHGGGWHPCMDAQKVVFQSILVLGGFLDMPHSS